MASAISVQKLLLSPKAPVGGWISRRGAGLLYPTATDDLLGTKNGARAPRPSLAANGAWTYGLLANQIWSFAGTDSCRSVNSTFLQAIHLLHYENQNDVRPER